MRYLKREPPPDEQRCRCYVSIKDVPRYTGRHRRGNNGFEMHFVERRCSRRALENGYCKQHGYKADT